MIYIKYRHNVTNSKGKSEEVWISIIVEKPKKLDLFIVAIFAL